MTKEYNYKLTSYNASFSLKEYTERYTEKSLSDGDRLDKIGCFFAPAFQRNAVWTDKAKSKLIETFLIKLPVPPVFLYRNIRAQHEIIDGYQRIKTVHDFMKNKLRLTGLDGKYNHKIYDDLSEVEKADFETKMLNCVIIENIEENKNREALYEIFARLNSGGTNLNNMEIRRAIGWGRLLFDIEEFNKTPEWKQLWGEKTANRYEDVELILRILALSETKYEKAMKEFLNEYLEENKDTNKWELLIRLKEAISLVLKNYRTNKPFHSEKGTRINFSLADSILPVIINHPEISNLSQKLHKLLDRSSKDIHESDSERELCEKFQEICFKGQGSISKKAVQERRDIAEKILLA